MKKILFILLMPLFCISQTVVNGNYNYTGKMQFSKYKNNPAKDSVLTVDTSGRLILKKFSTNWTDSLQVNNLGGNGNGIVGVDNNGKLSWQNIDSLAKGSIPLTGTASGNPVTGDIETNNKLIFVTPEYGKKVTLSAQFDVEDDAEVLLPRSAGTIALQTDIPFISLKNVLLAGNNSENNINVNNGFFVKIIGGGGVAFYTNPDFSDASSIVPMANPYEGLLLSGNEDTSKGLTGQYDYSANITSLSYTQKIYVDTAIATALSATPRVVASGQKSQALVAATTISVTIGATEPSTAYQVTVTPTSALSAALFYVDNKTTTTFDVVYLAGITGTVQFDWSVIR